MFMGFILHIYIIFGTNLLTGGPAHIAIFCLFQCFAEKEYQMESKRNETFARIFLGTNAIHRTCSGSQETSEADTRVPGAPSTLVGPSSIQRPTSSSYICPRTLKTIENEDRSGVTPLQASVATKNLSGARSGTLPEGESIIGGHLHHPGAIHDEEGVVHPRG